MSRPTRLFSRLAAFLCVAVLASLPRQPAIAAEVLNLYQGHAIVTGTVKENRPGGYATALEEVLVKVSGDPRLIGDKRVVALQAKAATLIDRHRYYDLLTGNPTHDEQGTRDRPYDLIVDFNRAKIDEALRALGRKPWGAERPRLVVLLGMRTVATSFMLAAGSDRDLELESIGLAAKQRGMPIALPDPAAMAATGLSVDNVTSADLAKFAADAKMLGGDYPLVGRMTWMKDTSDWTAEWRFAAQGQTYQWQERVDTYDNAFRNAFSAAARILSGNGAPQS